MSRDDIGQIRMCWVNWKTWVNNKNLINGWEFVGTLWALRRCIVANLFWSYYNVRATGMEMWKCEHTLRPLATSSSLTALVSLVWLSRQPLKWNYCFQFICSINSFLREKLTVPPAAEVILSFLFLDLVLKEKLNVPAEAKLSVENAQWRKIKQLSWV